MSAYDQLKTILQNFEREGSIEVMEGTPMKVGQTSGVIKGKEMEEEQP